MILFPAIDLFEGKAVRLYRGDYRAMTVYSERPAEVLRAFQEAGARHAHLVDLEGAKNGETRNFDTVQVLRETAPDLFLELGGGIRTLETAEKYLDLGIDRVIFGTAATDEGFLKEAAAAFGEKAAVGVDIRDGLVSVRGWTENAQMTAISLLESVFRAGIGTVIVTDIRKDGAMQGPNAALYRELMERIPLQYVASGGVSALSDLRILKEAGLSAAILGKAYYTGAIDLKQAVEEIE